VCRISAVNQDVVSIMQAAFQLQNTVQGFEDHVYLAVLNSENVFDTFEQVLNTITRRYIAAKHYLLDRIYILGAIIC